MPQAKNHTEMPRWWLRPGGNRGADEDPAYVHAVLEAYRQTPSTTGHVRPADRRLAQDLCRRKVPLATVQGALLLATVRRLARPADAPPLGPARSLAYFVPVIDELLATPLTSAYRAYLEAKILRLISE